MSARDVSAAAHRRYQGQIDRAMAEYDRLRAQQMTVAQLEANVRTYPPEGANARWRQVCVAELETRGR